MKNKVIVTITTLVLLALPGLSAAGEERPEISTDGMKLVEKDSRGSIYADPGVDWSVYSKIMLDEATVAFRKNWLRDQNRQRGANRITSSDMEKIKTNLAELFDEVFVAELTAKGGFEIVQAADEDVLRITPHIVDLDAYAPDKSSSSFTRTYSDSAGKMTLKLELYDSQTGDLIAVASDRQEARQRGYAQWANSTTNKGEARAMLQRWASGLRKRLNETTQTTVVD